MPQNFRKKIHIRISLISFPSILSDSFKVYLWIPVILLICNFIHMDFYSYGLNFPIEK